MTINTRRRREIGRHVSYLGMALLVVCASVQSQEQTVPAKPAAKSKASGQTDKRITTDQRGTDKSPLVVKVVPYPDAEGKAPEASKERDRAESTTRLGVVANILAALAAGAAALISVFALLSARDALHKSQRPWVTAESIVLREPILFDVRGPYEINVSVTLRNTGTSLANKVLMWIRLAPNRGGALAKDWIEAVDDFKRHKRIADETPWPLGVVIAPNQSVSIPFGWGGGNTATVEEIRNGSFYLMGYVEYLDQFGKCHLTRFCFNPNGDSVHPWDLKTFVVSGGFHEAT